MPVTALMPVAPRMPAFALMSSACRPGRRQDRDVFEGNLDEH
jgi:hypothetical protein